MHRQPTVISSKEHEYRLAELLGEGQFGRVYRGHCPDFPEGVAVKMIRKSKFSRNQKLKLLLQREIDVLSQFRHPHVIQFHEAIIDKQDVYLVYEYCEGGTLEDRITLQEQQLVPFLVQMADAMAEAERRGVMHRDIKPANILFQRGSIKIADWGFSRLLAEGQTACSFIGSPAYMAPEVLKGEEYSIKADVWSLGVVIYQLLTGACPWRSNSINSLSSQIARKSLRFPKGVEISYKMKMLISQMLSLSSSRRPTCSHIKERLLSSRSETRQSELLLGEEMKEIKEVKELKEVKEQKKIAGCVFFLQMVQWCRKEVAKSTTLLMFVRLIEKNLLKLRPEDREEQIFQVWEKEVRVVKEMKRKVQKKVSLTSLRGSSESMGRERELEYELNPEGQWEMLAKSTIRLVISLLEDGYRQAKEEQPRKHVLLLQINMLLDLVLFPQMPESYLKCTFEGHWMELKKQASKALLKLINHKLGLINKKYYR